MGDPFLCLPCDRWFDDYEDLERHVAKEHSTPTIEQRWIDLAAALPNHPVPEGLDPRYVGPTCPWCGIRTASGLAWGNEDGVREDLDGLPEWDEADNERLCWGECGSNAMQRSLDACRAAYVAGGWIDYQADNDDLLGVIRDLLVALFAAHGIAIPAPHQDGS